MEAFHCPHWNPYLAIAITHLPWCSHLKGGGVYVEGRSSMLPWCSHLQGGGAYVEGSSTVVNIDHTNIYENEAYENNVRAPLSRSNPALV
jgi:hypothetical protein